MEDSWEEWLTDPQSVRLRQAEEVGREEPDKVQQEQTLTPWEE